MDVSVAPAFANDTNISLPTSLINKQYYHRVQSRVFLFPDVQAYLVGEISEEFIVIQPLKLNVEQEEEDQSYVVSDDIFLVYGSGNNRKEAISDYAVSLAEFYEILESSENSNPFDKKLFVHLQSYIQRRGNDAVQTNRS